jgi:hypothetical protein
MKRTSFITIAAAAVIVALTAGCSSLVTINDRAVSVDDVIRMTEAGVGRDVIIRQIEVTRTRFELTPTDIIHLKKAGVDDKVLEVMVETEAYRRHFNDGEFGYDPYDYGFNYYSQWYPVSTHYPYIYHSMYPYTSYRRTDLIGRFYRYAPVQTPPYRIYDRRQEWYYPERRDPEEEDDR